MKRILLGIGSLMPTIVITISLVFAMVINVFNVNGEIPVPLRIPIILWMLLLFLSVILVWCFIIGYMIHVVSKNNNVSGGKRVGWIISFWLLNIISIPIYWYKYIY